jgi:hypothetical protein
MTRDAGFKRRVRARMAKTGERYAAARRHEDRDVAAHEHVDLETAARQSVQRTPSLAGELRFSATTLHVTNGESTVLGLRAAGLGGQVLAWRDVLHEGQVPVGLSPSRLRAARAAALGRLGLDQAEDALSTFAARDRLLAAHRAGAFVLWFEADLYDQLQVIQILDRLATLHVEPRRILLISIGEYPGRAHFGGLGELEPQALARLPADGVACDAASLALAQAAWQAYRAPEPSGLAALVHQTSPQLRFLGEAIGRLLQEYPWLGDGLSRTERHILLALEAAGGAERPAALFRGVWQRERRPFLGDTVFALWLRRLADGPQPLIVRRDDRLELTPVGRAVLAGQADAVRLNGLDRWLGGTHLHGAAPAWRYDPRLETVIPAPS